MHGPSSLIAADGWAAGGWAGYWFSCAAKRFRSLISNVCGWAAGGWAGATSPSSARRLRPRLRSPSASSPSSSEGWIGGLGPVGYVTVVGEEGFWLQLARPPSLAGGGCVPVFGTRRVPWRPDANLESTRARAKSLRHRGEGGTEGGRARPGWQPHPSKGRSQRRQCGPALEPGAGGLTRAKDGVNEGSVARPWSQGLAASPGVRRWRQQARPCSGPPKVL